MSSFSGARLAPIINLLILICLINLVSYALGKFSRFQANNDENWINIVEDDTFLNRPPLYGLRGTPRYLTVAPRYVRPGQVYRIAVSLLSSDYPIIVRASLHRDEREEVASDSERVLAGTSETLIMQIPVTAQPGNYKLRLEGNYNGALGGNAFRNETEVEFSQRFLTILIQTNQLVYNHKQPIMIRIILLTTQLKPYSDPADVYLIDSRGLVMKRWYSMFPYLGFINLRFDLPSDFPTGWWTVKVNVLSQTEEKKIKLERWFGDRFDVNVTLPGFLVSSQEYLEGAVRANYTNFAPVIGNLTVRAVVKPLSSEDRLKKLENKFKGKNHVDDRFRSRNITDVRFRSWSQANERQPGRSANLNEEERRTGERRTDQRQAGERRTDDRRTMERRTGDRRTDWRQDDRFSFRNQRARYSYLEQVLVRFPGWYEFKFSMEELQTLAQPNRLEDCEIEIRAYVGERYMNHVVKGYSKTRVFDKMLKLQFMGVKPQIFKPGMPFETHLTISYSDQVPLESEKLGTGTVVIQPTAVVGGGGRFDLEKIEEKFDEGGVLKIKIDTSNKAEKIMIRAWYTDEHDRVETELTVHAYYSTGQRYMQITSSTKAGQAGEYAIFHVWANFFMKLFNYLVVSKGIILQMGKQKVNGISKSITTFAIPISPEMAPSCRIVVYHVAQDGEVVADSVALPVRGINRFPFVLRINDKQDRTGSMVELVSDFTTEGIVGISAVDVDMLPSQGRSDLSASSILEAMYRFDEGILRTQKVVWLDREGGPEKMETFVTPNYAMNANQTFDFAGLVVFTNMQLTTVNYYCNISSGLLPCMSGQCYPAHKICDGFSDCQDGTDEGNCGDSISDSDHLAYHLYRTNRQYEFYESSGSDFAWKDVLMGDQTAMYTPCYPPKRPTLFKLSALAMSKIYGFAIAEKEVYVDSTNPFFITVEAPRTAVIGEQIGLRVVIFNYQVFEIKAEVILGGSEDYKFVEVGSLGIVKSYNPKTHFGEHQHLLYVKPHSQKFVYIPIVAARVGKITVNIKGRTQIATDEVNTEIDILADGVPVFQHTSMLLDMRSQAYNIKFLDLNVSDDPIIPFEERYRRFMFDSPIAKISVIGDVVGAPISKKPVDASLLRMAKPVKSGEHLLFNFAYNVHFLHYLRLTDQLNSATSKNMLEYLNKAYVYQSVFFINGSFTMFKKEPSIWLTALCARTYWLAQYPGWENHLYIDPKIISDSIQFILNHQTINGSFMETTRTPWNKKMASNPSSNQSPKSYHEKNVTLTAHVLITLAKVTDLLGDLRPKASNAKARAKKYLEHQLPALEDPYDIAIVTYALMEAGSAEVELGYDKLEQRQRSAEGMVYWSPEPIPPPEIIYQSQRPFVQPRNPKKHDSIAVEATAYALMVYTRKGGLIQDRIVNFLNTMRFTDPAFVSTQDTIVALEALVDYSFRTHVRDVTSMELSVHVSANPNKTYEMKITPDNLAEQRSILVNKNVWGHVEVLSKGSGMAVLQLDLQYNVDREFLLIQPSEDAFDLRLEYNFHGRNKSHYNIKSCARWKLTSESNTSGVAVIEISLPTGYLAQKNILNRYVQKQAVPRLRRARVLPRSAVFMFDYLDSDWNCVNFTVERWYPVANLTRYLKARVYDYYMPERYKEIIFEDIELYSLNICEVCGSYQCPYCPHFSAASNLVSFQFLKVILCLTFCWLLSKDWSQR